MGCSVSSEPASAWAVAHPVFVPNPGNGLYDALIGESSVESYTCFRSKSPLSSSLHYLDLEPTCQMDLYSQHINRYRMFSLAYLRDKLVGMVKEARHLVNGDEKRELEDLFRVGGAGGALVCHDAGEARVRVLSHAAHGLDQRSGSHLGCGLESAPPPRLLRTVPTTVPKIAARSTKEDAAMMIAWRQLVLLQRAPSSTLP
ncbi:hypothetical protein NL676_014643 [Syzygium grande]|nr:hypothetical protein NL676_014643 [Syzygium grande]